MAGGAGGRRGRGFFQDRLLELALHQNQAVVQRQFVYADIIFFLFFRLQPHAPGSLLELESKEKPLLNAAANTPATPVLPLPPANPSDVVLGER